MTTFGENVTALRDRFGLTQYRLAQMAGISRSHLYYIEHDEAVPTIVVAQKLAEALHTTIDALMAVEPEPVSIEERQLLAYLLATDPQTIWDQLRPHERILLYQWLGLKQDGEIHDNQACP
jgi:transcriptional regulator with XRE-family HTH domain